MYKLISCIIYSFIAFASAGQSTPEINLVHDPSQERIQVLVDGTHFTSYLYSDTMEKPILFPIYAKSNRLMTRGYPLIPLPNERIDHPHHVGMWFNYGNVNGLDFWNNSSAIPLEKKSKYGEIKHGSIVLQEETNGKATLAVVNYWCSPDQEKMLEEATEFEFSTSGDTWIIDRSTTLKALTDVSFSDNKEGMLGIRVARLLEFPSDKPLALTDEHGRPRDNKVINNDSVHGNYLSSTGVEGGDVWGTRASWMKLYAPVGDKKEAGFVIIDHPKNVGYPTYWHARTYGLFAANPLGQKVFTKGKEQLDFSLKKGEKVTFKYRILVMDGTALTAQEIEALAMDFAQ